jgi:hypothetical protein
MIPNSTMYCAVDGSDIIQAKGSKKAMRSLVKQKNACALPFPRWYVGNSPSGKVGDTFGRTSEEK